jgi:hypothetical protein
MAESAHEQSALTSKENKPDAGRAEREYRRQDRVLFVRRGAAVILILVFPVLASCGIGSLLLLIPGILCMVVGAVLLAPDVAAAGARMFSGILWPSASPATPRPVYTIPQSLVAQHRYTEALQAYNRIIAEYPEEARPYLELIKMAATQMKDAQMAHEFYERAMAVLTSPEDRERITTVYGMFTEGLTTPKQKPKSIAYRQAKGTPSAPPT